MNANTIIDALGGSTEVARLCRVTVGAVSQWRHDGIPHARLMYLQLARPDVFARLKKRKRRRRIADVSPDIDRDPPVVTPVASRDTTP